MNNCVKIHGFEISSFRSFGEKSQRLGPFQPITLITGLNNSGKSNVLRFILDVIPELPYGNLSAVLNKHRPHSGRLADSIIYHVRIDDDTIDNAIRNKNINTKNKTKVMLCDTGKYT